MEKSVLFNQASELLSLRQYTKAFKLLQEGYDQNDIFCVKKMVNIYGRGGWGVERNLCMHKIVESKYTPTFVSITQEPILTGSHSSAELYIHYLYTLRDDKKLSELKKDEFIRHYQNLVKFAKQLKVNAVGLIFDFLISNKTLKYVYDITETYHSLLLLVADQKNVWIKERILALNCRNCILIEAKLHAKDYNWIENRLLNASTLEIYTIGRFIYKNQLNHFITPFEIEMGRKAAQIFINVTFRFKRSIITWLLVAKEMKITKDIYILIGKMTYDIMKSEGAWGREEEEEEEREENKRIKI
jgi:hypothetical protein